MTYLFIFAHPDDETVACAGTIKKLVENGEKVIVVSVTDGGAGEVKELAQLKLKELGSVNKLRMHELKQVCDLLGVSELRVLDFADGQITNEIVWGKLKSVIVDLIDETRADFVITFDHSGWYFHLDHVGVSIATTLAVQEAAYPPEVFFLSHFRVNQTKWKYIYSEKMPLTHQVDISDVHQTKLQALDLHESQNLNEPRRQLAEEKTHREFYQLASCTEKGKELLEKHTLFEAVEPIT